MARVRLGRFPSTEGQLARLALEQESIEVELIGEQLSTLQGAIPSSEVMVELWVEPEHLERAQRVLTTALRENAKGTADVRCPSCGADNPANFDVCWSCQGDLALAERLAASAPVGPRGPKPRPPIFAAVFACTTLLFAALLWKESQLAKFAESPNVHFRWASQSCLVQEVHGRMLSRSCDSDHDGTFEQVESFDVKGRLVDTAYDANEDGVVERVDTFDARGKLIRRTLDLDVDWRFDRTDGFDLLERLVVRETDSDGDGRIDRTEGIDGGQR